MLMKKPEHKRFEYLPRYYKPEKDKEQKFREKFELARKSHSLKKKSNKIILYLIIIFFIIYLMIRFNIV